MDSKVWASLPIMGGIPPSGPHIYARAYGSMSANNLYSRLKLLIGCLPFLYAANFVKPETYYERYRIQLLELLAGQLHVSFDW